MMTMKKVIVCICVVALLAILLPGCATDKPSENPIIIAQAEAIRLQAVQDAADRSVARQDNGNPVIWFIFGFLFSIAVVTSILLGVLYLRRDRPAARKVSNSEPSEVIQITNNYAVIIARSGRGAYSINPSSRLLDWRNPDDAVLLQELFRVVR
jgi:hypothetical protein